MASKTKTAEESSPKPTANPAPIAQRSPAEPGQSPVNDQKDIDMLMAAAAGLTNSNSTADVSRGDSGRSPSGAQVQSFDFPTFDANAPAAVDAKRVSMLSDVNLRVKIELGRTRMLVEDVLKLGEGSVVELDKLAGDPVDVYANDRLVARGEVLVLDESFCVRISDVVSRDPHRIIR